MLAPTLSSTTAQLSSLPPSARSSSPEPAIEPTFFPTAVSASPTDAAYATALPTSATASASLAPTEYPSTAS